MRASLLVFGFALGAVGTVVDPQTGIAFQRSSSTAGYNFGIALPQNPTTDFIGQIVIPTTGTGYGGLSLTGMMANSLLIVAWPNGNNVVAGFRYTTGHTAPSAYSAAYAPGSKLNLTSIARGTYVNSTHLSYTFICKGCITGDSLSFSPSLSTTTFGWSLSGNAVTSPESATSAAFKFHNVGYGQFQIDLNAAKSADYESWVAGTNTTVASSTSTQPSGTAATFAVSNPSSTGSPKADGGSPGRLCYDLLAVLPLILMLSVFLL